MKLKPRLSAVAEMVRPGDAVADIGTDHAYLPVFLVLNKSCPRAIGVEKSPRNVQAAEETVARFELEDRVEIRLGDGFKALKDSDEVHTAVVAGLGGKTICRMLSAVRDSLFSYRRLVLQPMVESAMLRRWLAAHGFCLVEERLARERNRFYEIMAAEPGHQMVDDPFLLELGPVLVREKDPLLVPWLERKIHCCEKIVQGLRSSERNNSTAQRLFYYERRCRQLKGVLEHDGYRK